MTTPTSASPPGSLHRRLTVALASAPERAEVCASIHEAIHDTGTQAVLLSERDLLAAASGFADVRSDERAELVRRLERAAERAEEVRVAASRAVRDLVDRRCALVDGAAWARQAAPELRLLRESVEEARVALDERAGELREAQAALERVLEQRAAAAGALEEADRELSELSSVAMDEPGLRRELEMAGRSVRDAAQAHRDAVGSLASLEVEAAALEDRLATARSLAAGGVTGGAAPDQIERVLDAYEAYRDAAARPVVLGPAPAAIELAEAWRDLMADFAEAGHEATDAPSPDELAAAEREAAEAGAELARLEQASQEQVLTAAQRADLEAAHEAVAEAEERAGRRFGAAAAKARLDEAKAHEAALLAQHGFASYLEVMLTGGRVGSHDLALTEAERRYIHACKALEHLRQSGSSAALSYLESERCRLLDHVVALLGVDPGDRVLELLESHPPVDGHLVRELREALAMAGVEPVGVALLDAAASWLEEQRAVADALVEVEDERASALRTVAELEGQVAEMSSLLDAGRLRVAEAEEKLEMAQRSVGALEAELTVRAGADTQRLKRFAAAEQLRAQVDALQVTLERAESSARGVLDQAMTSHAEAEVVYERAASAVADLARRARQLADHVHSDEPVPAELLDRLHELAAALDAAAATLDPDLAVAEEALASAEAELEDARAAAEMASRATDGPQHEDHVAGLAQMIDCAGGPDDVVVLDDPFAGSVDGPVEELLEVVRNASSRRQIVLVTQDPAALGWAIELPADAATAVPADSLLVRLRRDPVEPTEPTRPDDSVIDVEPLASRRAGGR